MADARAGAARLYASLAEVRADVERAGGETSALCGLGRCFCVKAAPGLTGGKERGHWPRFQEADRNRRLLATHRHCCIRQPGVRCKGLEYTPDDGLAPRRERNVSRNFWWASGSSCAVRLQACAWLLLEAVQAAGLVRQSSRCARGARECCSGREDKG